MDRLDTLMEEIRSFNRQPTNTSQMSNGRTNIRWNNPGETAQHPKPTRYQTFITDYFHGKGKQHIGSVLETARKFDEVVLEAKRTQSHIRDYISVPHNPQPNQNPSLPGDTLLRTVTQEQPPWNLASQFFLDRIDQKMKQIIQKHDPFIEGLSREIVQIKVTMNCPETYLSIPSTTSSELAMQMLASLIYNANTPR